MWDQPGRLRQRETPRGAKVRGRREMLFMLLRGPSAALPQTGRAGRVYGSSRGFNNFGADKISGSSGSFSLQHSIAALRAHFLDLGSPVADRCPGHTAAQDVNLIQPEPRMEECSPLISSFRRRRQIRGRLSYHTGLVSSYHMRQRRNPQKPSRPQRSSSITNVKRR